ncbi:MAG: tRNA1(Val) (adenine(37)-N6)-methyltransferase [Dysgonomonas sp.]
MPDPCFRFKEFTVYHDQCAMKVGTDGVVLGAWVSVGNVNKVLDVGAGSGLIALMLAQRAKYARIDSVEPDEAACRQANANYKGSPFDNITTCLNLSLQEFYLRNTDKYDLIVSNPPFFKNSLKSPNDLRNKARHTDSLSVEDLIKLSATLLTETGRFALIFPYTDKELLLSLGDVNGLYVSRITDVCPTPDSLPKRVLLEFSKNNVQCDFSTLVLETERHVYSPDYTELVKDFYLKL